MLSSLTIRFWIELILATCSAAATVASLVWPQWIEAMFEASPDDGDGSAEWLIAIAFLAATIAFSWFARSEWRQAVIRRRNAV